MTPTSQAAYDLVTALLALPWQVPFVPKILTVILLLTFLRWAVRRSRGRSSLYGESLTYGTAEDARDAWHERRAAARDRLGRRP